jgi:hypothetical protein
MPQFFKTLKGLCGHSVFLEKEALNKSTFTHRPKGISSFV